MLAAQEARFGLCLVGLHGPVCLGYGTQLPWTYNPTRRLKHTGPAAQGWAGICCLCFP